MVFYVEVVFVDTFFGLDFSPQADKFDSLNLMTLSVSVFVAISYIFTYRINTNFNFESRLWKYKDSDLIIFVLISLIAAYLTVTKGIRLSGSFVDYAGERSVLEDYLFPIIVVLLVISKARFFVVVGVLLLSLSYFLAGERMRMFVYLFTIFLLFSKKQNSNLFKTLLFFALSSAMIMSLFRSGLSFSEEYHVSHFGSVTVSSMFYMDFIAEKNIFEKISYFIGIIAGNIIPSSWLLEGFDVRRDLFASKNIPGGGWLPVWFYGIFGMTGLVSFSLSFACCIRVMSLRLQKFVSGVDEMVVIFFITFVATLPRWFMYTPYQLIKFPLYSVLVYLGLKGIKHIILVGCKND